MTTSPWAASWPSEGASEAASSAISDWPSGIATLVLRTGYELYVVDHAGIRWSQEVQTPPDPNTNWPLFDGVAVSNNQQFVAYVDHARDIVVRSVPDGSETGRVTYDAEGETQLRCVSSDGDFVALVSAPPDLPQGTTGDRLPWRVTVVDMRSRQVTIERPLEDLVKERTADDPEAQFTLYSLDWLPGHKLLVNYAGWDSETHTYDLGTEVMEEIPGMALVMSVSDSGTVYGGTIATSTAPPTEEIWDGHTTQVLELDPGWGHASGGVLSMQGDALAIQVMSPRYEPLGWQVFRLSQGRWERSGPLAENSWMKAAPVALSADGTLAYAALDGGLRLGNSQNPALLSYDFKTGAWQAWLGPEDFQVRLGQYPFVAIIPER